MDELAHGGFAAVLGGIGALGDVAVEIFRDGDLGGEHAPALGHFDVLLLEDGLAGVVGDFRRALFPFDLVVGMNARLGERPARRSARVLRTWSWPRLACHDGGRMDARRTRARHHYW